MIQAALPAVVDALAGQTGIDAARIEPDKPLSAIPDVDSIQLLLALTAIEETYAVLIPDHFLFGTSTVRELADLVSRLADQR
jgi:acyl carrier protein